MNFIRLTETQKEEEFLTPDGNITVAKPIRTFCINMDKIFSFSEYTGAKCTMLVIASEKLDFLFVKETPEEIMALIEEAKKR